MLLKILLFPVTVILNILLGISKFVLIFGAGILGVISFFFFLFAILGFIMGEGVLIGIPFIILGYLISPWGLPKLGLWIVSKVEQFNRWLGTL